MNWFRNTLVVVCLLLVAVAFGVHQCLSLRSLRASMRVGVDCPDTPRDLATAEKSLPEISPSAPAQEARTENVRSAEDNGLLKTRAGNAGDMAGQRARQGMGAPGRTDAAGRRGKTRQSLEHSSSGDPAATLKSNQLLSRARALMRTGDYDGAEDLLRQSLESQSDNRRAWQQMALLQRKQGLTEAEMDLYRQWMEKRPGDAAPYYMLAETLTRLGMDTEARQYLAEYETRADDGTDAYARAARLYRQLQDREEEGRLLAQWMDATPGSPDAQWAWADYQRRLGGYDEALSQYTSLASSMPGNPLPYRQMGDIYRRLGDYDQAQSHYETALALRPDDIETMNHLADARFRAGDVYGALDAYGLVVDMEPGSRAAAQADRRITAIERRLPRAGTP